MSAANQEQTTSAYLGMNPGQFGMVMCLTSLSRQMQTLVEGEDMQNLMAKLISEHGEKTTAETLEWVRSQRNHILNVLHGVLVAQNLLAQVDDALVATLVAPTSTADADNNQNENSGE
ncbi:hypothetical protein pEaSNUABM56_00091 [Erwinia phage pEa_SNUABM_56]|uniref:Uncharacterized protein n=1 Tax=Erwinia phage pEp_SNUABM_01 TaxID=2601643 RepID=A0A5J6DAL3_9CAUD|nr:hypothetical protein HWC63_gp064 [Erwinia phage pEp_SNUABM_01]QEQ94890.1 hypothetical protein pEpSNUABM01_064 [Erwinia phage pEp_SNUABM_01]UYL84821.1 hypothetical protein pEaSNUABM55_00023 [Erwinia phage pEa_SNUABM_55]UYL85136.1 hypothetical protein pEaSNUABM56_00091 [Erwinia phage pEa_SNUABM_56]